MHTDAHTNTDVGRVKDTVSYRQTNTHTNPISHPDGDRAAADVVGRAGALLAQVTCSQQLAQVRHSWELKPQGKCSRWLGGWRCGRQAGRLAHHLPYTHTLRKMDESRWKKTQDYCHRHPKVLDCMGIFKVSLYTCTATWSNMFMEMLSYKQTYTQRIWFGLKKEACKPFLSSTCLLLSSSLSVCVCV